MKEIQLANGKGIAIVDDSDYELVSRYKWCIKKGGYAAGRTPMVNGERSYLLMHRLIMGAKLGQQIDHVNRNPLDNRRSNLRFCTTSQNKANSTRDCDNKSGYKGVVWHKRDKRWQATVKVNGRARHLGLFTNPADAAIAYNIAALKHFGEFARLNTIPPGEAI